MKSTIFAAIAGLFLVSTAFAADHAQLAAEAKAKFQQRDFSPAGIASAQAAADKYAEAVTVAPDNTLKATYLVGQSEALFFVGQANSDKAPKVAAFTKGVETADQAAKILGIADVSKATDAAVLALKGTLTPETLALLGEALYSRGISLGQWGAANGVVDSLGKWPELRRNMEIVDVLGLKAIHDYGAYRVLGRGYFKIPGMLGGDMKKAEKYLSEAFNATKWEGQNFSRSGYNTIYYAELLNENGDEAATEILEAFIAADATKVRPEAVEEFRNEQKEAKELLASW